MEGGGGPTVTKPALERWSLTISWGGKKNHSLTENIHLVDPTGVVTLSEFCPFYYFVNFVLGVRDKKSVLFLHYLQIISLLETKVTEQV